ncbi:MAG: hemolysin family protein [Actinomycetota bacterium]
MTAWYLLAAVLLLVANGFFVGAEFALVAARRTRIEHLAEQGGGRARAAFRSIRELSLMLAGAQLGITMCSLGLGYVAEPAVASLIENAIHAAAELPPTLLHTISFVVALTIVTFFHMVIGEMAPKNIAIAEPEKTALLIAWPFRIFVNLFRPFVRLLNLLANGGTRLLGFQPQDEMTPAHTAEELGIMIEESARGGAIPEFERRLLAGAIGFRERDAGSAMVPRTEMVAVPVTTTVSELERTVLETGHTRFPVYTTDLDHVLGFLHAKDLLKVRSEERSRPLPGRFIRRMLIVPESRRLHPLLVDMQRERKHFALVVDEHGGTAGVVTLEDLVEELVGEIRDEYDIGELGVERMGDGRYLVPGSLRIDEASDHLDVELPRGDYDTVAGFLMARLGRIPRRRDVVEHDAWRLRVTSMHRRRVVQVLIERTSCAPPPRVQVDGRATEGSPTGG